MREVVSKLLAEETIIQNIKDKKEDEFFYQYKNTMVISSKSNALDKDFCSINSIEIYNASNMGGTIVANAGDIGIAYFKVGGWNIGRVFLNTVKDYLSQEIEDISVVGNDLVVDGKYKVGSFASINCGNDYIYTAAHLTYEPRMDLIEKICTKDMVKIPKGLKEYGLTTDGLRRLVYDVNYTMHSQQLDSL